MNPVVFGELDFPIFPGQLLFNHIAKKNRPTALMKLINKLIIFLKKFKKFKKI